MTALLMDHDYTVFTNVTAQTVACVKAVLKRKRLSRIKISFWIYKIIKLLKKQKQYCPGFLSVASTFLKNDAKIKIYIGLQSKQSFENLCRYLFKNAKKMTYWKGSEDDINQSPTKMQKVTKYKWSREKTFHKG